MATAVRLAAMPLPGTVDVGTWKIWSYAASEDPTAVYGIGGDPPARRMLQWNDRATTVDYPPLAMFALGLSGALYRLYDPAFTDGPLLVVAIKLPGLFCGLGLTWLLAWTVWRVTNSAAAARWTALAWWANPAAILNAEVLGYLDPLMMLPALAAFVLLHAGSPLLAGAYLAIAVLTKPQGALLAPACLLAAWQLRGARGAVHLAAGAGALTAAVLLPVALAGALPNMWLAFGSFYGRRDILSGYAANIWWIVNYLLRAWYQVPELGWIDAFLAPVTRIMAVSTFQEVGFPNPRPFATALSGAVIVAGLWRARLSNGLTSWLLAATFTIQAFFVLSVGVHEHHMMLAVPLLALAAGIRPRLRPFFYTITVIVALNMNLFYGISYGMGWSLPRGVLLIDTSVLLSIANIGALLWGWRLIGRLGELEEAQIGIDGAETSTSRSGATEANGEGRVT